MPALPSTLCYLNGEFLPVDQAKVSVLDRGFIFGDGVYDVAPVYGRKLFRFDAHMARLSRSLASLRLPNPFSRDDWLAHCRTLIEAQAADDQVVYMQVTRGPAPRDHVMPTEPEPTVFMMASAMKPPGAVQLSDGVDCITARDFRWERADIKSVSLLGNVLARQMSFDAGAVETILFRDGLLTEASASNVWVVRGGKVYGPPKSGHVLEGVRYELLRELCEEEGIAFELRPIDEREVRSADELMLSSASKEVLAVTRLDGQAIGQADHVGRPGPVFARLHAAYQRAKAAQCI